MTKLTRWFRLAFGTLLLLASAWPPIGAAPVSATPLLQPPQPSEIEAFALVTPAHGWLLLDQRLYWTGNDGQAWQDITPAAAGAAFLAAAAFADTQHGWVVTTGGSESAPTYQLYRTADGGASWTGATLDLFAPDEAAALPGAVYLDFIDALHGWLVVKQATSSAFNLGTLFRTDDGGSTWDPLTLPAGAPVRFTTPEEGTLETGPPENARYRSHDGGATWELEEGAVPPAPDPAGVSEISLATANVGWGRSAVGACDESGCALRVQLVRTSDGGQTWTPVPLPNGQTTLAHTFEQPAEGTAPHALPGANGLALDYTGHGFDACPGNPLDANFISKMQTWSTQSPYRVWNLYIGGTAVASCGTLTTDILQQLSTQGWLFIPTWVGPQAPCSGFSRRMSGDAATAYQQGVIEAHLAMDRAEALRLALPGQFGTAIYYDLESYSGSANAGCREAVKTFISGWTATLRARGHLAGVYGSPCGSFMADFVNIPHVPDVVWLAAWTQPYFHNPSASVWNLACVGNNLWTQNQRLRQYTGGHNETWGGATFNIDSDVIAGVVTMVSGNCVPGAGQAALFVHANFGGQCVLKNIGDYANPAALGLPNDSLTSVRLGPNTRIQLCRDDNYGGTCQQLIGSDTNLMNDPVGNDQVSSAKVMAHTPTLTTRLRFPMFRLGPAATVGLPNGGFESGPAGWSTASARGRSVIVPNNALPAGVSAHGGGWAVWLGGVHTETVTLQQVVGIPGDAPHLSYWQQIKSSETACYYDVASIWVNGSVVDSYGLCANTGWIKQRVDLSAYAGSTVTLKFQVTTDTSLVSSLFIDDLSFGPGP